jgi:hypothetical protein
LFLLKDNKTNHLNHPFIQNQPTKSSTETWGLKQDHQELGGAGQVIKSSSNSSTAAEHNHLRAGTRYIKYLEWIQSINIA